MKSKSRLKPLKRQVNAEMDHYHDLQDKKKHMLSTAKKTLN